VPLDGRWLCRRRIQFMLEIRYGLVIEHLIAVIIGGCERLAVRAFVARRIG
jgi:hypothetical protein